MKEKVRKIPIKRKRESRKDRTVREITREADLVAEGLLAVFGQFVSLQITDLLPKNAKGDPLLSRRTQARLMLHLAAARAAALRQAEKAVELAETLHAGGRALVLKCGDGIMLDELTEKDRNEIKARMATQGADPHLAQR